MRNSQSGCLLYNYPKMACVALNRRKYLISIWAQYLGESTDIFGYCDVIDNQSEATKWAGYEMSNYKDIIIMIFQFGASGNMLSRIWQFCCPSTRIKVQAALTISLHKYIYHECIL